MGKIDRNQEKTVCVERILYYDVLKLLAAFLVVFYHYANHELDFGFTGNLPYYPNLDRILMSFASCSVPIFFVVNGALMLSRDRTVKYIWFRAAKLIVLIFVWRATGFLSWFFITLTIYYSIFPIIQYCWNNYRKPYYLGMLCILIMPFGYNAIILLLRIAGICALNKTGVFTMYGLLYFMLGPILTKNDVGNRKMGIAFAATGWIVVCLESVIYTNITGVMHDGVNSCFPTIGALLLTVGMVLIFRDINFRRCKRWIEFAANGILPIYLTHMLFIFLLEDVGLYADRLSVALIGTIGICAIGILIGNVVKKIPVIQWFFKI